METTSRPVPAETPVHGRPSERIFYRLFLPIAVTANLVLGLIILSGLRPYFWTEWLEIATGAFCCLVAGGLAAAAWSKFYWGRSIAHQILLCRLILATFFTRLVEASLPAE